MAVLLTGCTADEVLPNSDGKTGKQELTAFRAEIMGGASGARRAGTVTTLVHYVGRQRFKPDEETTFTKICRTEDPLTEFTYKDIVFRTIDGSGWTRKLNDDGTPFDGGKDRVYWTDAVKPHTFIAYNKPATDAYDWKKYQFVEGGTQKTYYLGSLGNPMLTGAANDTIVYADSVSLANEDLLLAYDEGMQVETGGNVALVKFYHALSSVRVIVNISGFSSTSSDYAAVVSNMKLLHQPTMYVWMQANTGAQALRVTRNNDGSIVSTDQPMVNTAWDNGGSNQPDYDQRKALKLWIPQPAGTGSAQSKTFTFYGITTPQDFAYISTLPEGSDYRKVELQFDVTYPNPLKPSTNVTRTYTATLADNPDTEDVDETVYFEPNYNTTINISLNHRNELMTVGAEYENWQYVATPDVGQLKKNSTFLQSTAHDGVNVTIVGDAKATMDDATWLYDYNGTIYDIYGHDGSSEESAYQISTANQLLSFAYEVKNNRDFAGKFVRLDADITLQKDAEKTQEELVPNEKGELDSANPALVWIGIGDNTHAFNGTFLGGNRYIYRLKGSPLFLNVGDNAKIEQLQVQPISIGNGTYTAVDGGGVFAETNSGMICGSKVVGDVVLSGSTAGAFVGTNTGKLYASYHIGDTKGTTTAGGLVGSNAGIVASCYHAGLVTATNVNGICGTTSGTVDNCYYNNTLLTAVPTDGATGKSTTEMTKQAFVDALNAGITTWRTANPAGGYDAYQYVHQAANYPSIGK